jgi:hypothetical protein
VQYLYLRWSSASVEMQVNPFALAHLFETAQQTTLVLVMRLDWASLS